MEMVIQRVSSTLVPFLMIGSFHFMHKVHIVVEVCFRDTGGTYLS